MSNIVVFGYSFQFSPKYFINFLTLSFYQNYETSESKVKREFEAYGPIKRVGIKEHPIVVLGLLPFGSVRGSLF